MTAFLGGLHRELELRADRLDTAFGTVDAGDRPPLATLYLGGGTPSLLPADAVAELVGRVAERYGLGPGAEVTLEANPGPDDRGDLGGFARAGVTRLSLGAQSLDDADLRALGRRHRVGDVADAVAEARAAGIGQVSLDLLYDVPGQRLASWAATLEGALDLRPDHVSCYALTLDDPDAEGLTGPEGDHLPTTPGARRWRERARGAQDEDRAAAAYALADAALEGAGMPWYELSNWAHPGAESRHNLAYWQRLPYEAIGPGAHAFDGARRRWNAARLDGWLGALALAAGGPSRLPPGGEEVIDGATAEAEELILGLRTARGIGRERALARLDVFSWALDAGLVEEAPPRPSAAHAPRPAPLQRALQPPPVSGRDGLPHGSGRRGTPQRTRSTAATPGAAPRRAAKRAARRPTLVDTHTPRLLGFRRFPLALPVHEC